MKNKIIEQVQKFITENHDKNDEEVFRGFEKLAKNIRFKEREEMLRNYQPQHFSALADQQAALLNDKTYARRNKISSGFHGLDTELGCFDLGELVVIGGRPGMGKTQFLIQLCVNFLNQDHCALYFTLDLSRQNVFRRILCNISEVSIDELYNIESVPLKEVLRKNMESLKKWSLYIDDTAAFKLHDLIVVSEKMIRENGVKIIFVDYLQLLSNEHYRNNREQELSGISRELKKLARDLNVLVICTSQLSRQVENRPGGSKRPMLSDLRESGAIEQDADKVLFMYRPEYYGLEVDENNESTKDKVEILIAKNRTGRTNFATLYRNRNFTAFKETEGLENKINTYTNDF